MGDGVNVVPRSRAGLLRLAMAMATHCDLSACHLTGWRIDEDAWIDTEVSGQDGDVARVESAPAQQNF